MQRQSINLIIQYRGFISKVSSKSLRYKYILKELLGENYFSIK